MTDKVNWRDYPHLRHTGRYAFFALCGMGVGTLAGVFAVGAMGVARDISITIASVAGMSAFLALRDMSAAWQLALELQTKGLLPPPASLTRPGES